METLTGNSSLTYGTTTLSTGTLINTPTYLGENPFTLKPVTPTPNAISFSHPITFTQSTSKQIMQNKVAVFKVTRDEFETITKTEFIKELWVETKNGQSVDFQVARDKDLADYEMSDLSIRTIYSVSF
jgi:hypothetical protein